MPSFFVCEQGPMGGCNIVWVGNTQEDAVKAIQAMKAAAPGRELFIYQRVWG